MHTKTSENRDIAGVELEDFVENFAAVLVKINAGGSTPAAQANEKAYLDAKKTSPKAATDYLYLFPGWLGQERPCSNAIVLKLSPCERQDAPRGQRPCTVSGVFSLQRRFQSSCNV